MTCTKILTKISHCSIYVIFVIHLKSRFIKLLIQHCGGLDYQCKLNRIENMNGSPTRQAPIVYIIGFIKRHRNKKKGKITDTHH